MTGVQLVLDTTAVVAYTDSSIHVGEVLGELATDGLMFTCPILCLAEAGLAVKPDRHALIDVLTGHPQFVGNPLGDLVRYDRWRDLADGARTYGSMSRGCVASIALVRRAYILTAEPDAYRGLPAIGI